MCIIRYAWLIALYLFISLVRNTSFSIVKNSGVREELSNLLFFLQTQLQKITVKEHILVSLYLQPSPFVCALPQLALSPSPNYLHMCPFLSASSSTAAPFLR